RDPRRWMLPLNRLGHDIAVLEAHVVAGVSREGSLAQTSQRDARSLFPHCPLVARVDAERVELGRGGSFPGAELDPAAGEYVKCGDPLRDARRMIDHRHRVHDAVTEPDALRALRNRAEEDLGRARMRVLLQEV